MNRMICTLAAVFLTLAADLTYAQPKGQDDWKQRVKREKTEFFNRELRMDTGQAGKFWPVYEKISRSQWKAQKAVMDSKEALARALEERNADYKALLDAHNKACENSTKVNAAAVKQFRKEFGDEFTVRLLAAEENFRRAQIHRLNRGGGHPGKAHRPDAAGRPEHPDPCPEENDVAGPER